MSVKMTGFDRIERRFDEQRLLKEVEVAMRRAVEKGAESMVNTVETSGTNRVWSSPWFGRAGSGPGRIDTGEMLEGIDSDAKRTRNSVTGEFGWLKESPYWWLYQEYGFEHYISHEIIKGMESLEKADNEVFQDLLDELNDIANRFVSGRN